MTQIFCERINCIHNEENDCLKVRIKLIYLNGRAICVSYEEDDKHLQNIEDIANKYF